MTVTITRLFDDYLDASQAVRDLETAGLSSTDISIIASNTDHMNADKSAATYSDTKPRVDSHNDGTDGGGGGTEAGVGIGALIGGAAGLLVGLGLIAIPGIGPVVAAGWLVSTAAGAATVGVAGGIIGALTQAGVTKEDAAVYAEGIRRGGCIVTARVSDGDVARYGTILDRAAVNLIERQNAYRQSGWKGFSEDLRPSA